jgi:drug/metabolite transporter (DMT)-like permease
MNQRDPQPILMSEPKRPADRSVRHAELMILLATAIFGVSFAIAKELGTSINRAAGAEQSALGPMLVLAMRFSVASVVWLALVRPSRQGWKSHGVRRGLIIGALLTVGMTIQNVGLDYTSEAVSAFLTSLTVVFVPLAIWLIFRERPAASIYLGIALAVPGVWLMSGMGKSGFALGIGEIMGIACAIVFSFHMISINTFTPLETPWRMAIAQFAVAGVVCWAVVIAMYLCLPSFDFGVFATFSWWRGIGILIFGPTLIAFGLMTVYQPKISTVRAVLIYLLEPVFASVFAWFWSGSRMTFGMIIGGALILIANAVVELLPQLRKNRITSPDASR